MYPLDVSSYSQDTVQCSSDLSSSVLTSDKTMSDTVGNLVILSSLELSITWIPSDFDNIVPFQSFRSLSVYSNVSS